MKSIKGRFFRRYRTIPSIYTIQHVAPVPCQSPETLSCTQNLLTLPNYIQQEHRANTNIYSGEEECESILSFGKKNGHIISCDLIPTDETDVFEECEFEFDDSMPEKVSSSSSSSCTSPTSINCKSNEDVSRTNSSTTNLIEFEEKCPPGGSDIVILYTTSLKGIRKTYEDCHAIKFLLESFRVVYFERDVSMHLEFRNELWSILEGRSIPPRLFIKGRYIGGADEVAMLHERGTLKKLLQGVPVHAVGSNPKCSQCGGIRFLLCIDCKGSRKVYKGDQGTGRNLFGRCLKCNENGLIKCPTCSK